MKERVVLLLGRSLLVSGVANGLRECAGLVVLLAPCWAEAEALLTQYRPDALVFSLADAGDSHLLPLLCQNPTLVLVGLDTERNRAVLLTGRVTRALTLERMKEIVTTGD
jgi:hypothetical protein